MVLYSGVTPWNAATRLRDNIDARLPPPRHLQSDISYILLDEGEMLRTSDLPVENLATLLFRLEYSQDVEDVRQLMQTIGRLTQDPRYEEARRAFLDWATHVLLPRALDGQATPVVHSLQEFDNTWPFVRSPATAYPNRRACSAGGLVTEYPGCGNAG